MFTEAPVFRRASICADLLHARGAATAHGPRLPGVVHMVYVYKAKGTYVTCVRRWPDSATSVSCARS